MKVIDLLELGGKGVLKTCCTGGDGWWEGVGGTGGGSQDGRRTRVLPGRGETTAAHGHSVRE